MNQLGAFVCIQNSWPFEEFWSEKMEDNFCGDIKEKLTQSQGSF